MALKDLGKKTNLFHKKYLGQKKFGKKRILLTRIKSPMAQRFD